MRVICLLLISLLCGVSLCLAAPDDDNGEVRLYLRAAFTGYHTWQSKQRGAGEHASASDERVQDKATVVFEGTSSWPVRDWVPGEVTHNCKVSVNGGGAWNETERGLDSCGNGEHGDHPYVRTKNGRWTYSGLPETKTISPIMSPAGVVTVNPVGGWMLVLSAYPNLEDLVAKGSWFDRYAGCKGTTQDDYPIDKENNPPPGPWGIDEVKEAYKATLGGGGKYDQPIQGQWKVKDKGFFTSGHLYNEGGDHNKTLGEPPSGKADDGYFTGTEAIYWTADIFYTVSYTMKPPPVECIIETGPAYQKWVPQGGPDEQTVGNTLGLSAHLQVKGKRDKTPLQKGKFTFQLVESSHEPGVALNLPLTGPKSTPDLKFGESAGMKPIDDGKGCESTSEEVQAAQATLNCYDYGAFGKVRVVCKLTDGSVVYGHLDGEPAKEELSVPWDDNNNHVADSWESKEGVTGKPDNWDQEAEPTLDNVPGDGLTLYEEYRGLVHKGAIVRLSALRKDLVIVNEMGDRAGPGLKLFESASGIHVVELSKGELAADRFVNKHSSSAFLGPQYALRLLCEDLGPGIIGMSLPDRQKLSPIDCDKTAINTNLSFLPAGTESAMLAIGIAHELGHSLGAQHHGDSGSGTTREDLTITAATTKIYGIDGTAIVERPYTLHGLIETKANGGECSGTQECVMRNSSFFQWVQRLDRMGALSYYAVPPTPPGTLFCALSAGTGLNAAGHTPVCYFGNAAEGRGACQTHMRVNDH
ncbi:MAG: hypothetical protein WCP21_01795 [Armatimonadota bacterium]